MNKIFYLFVFSLFLVSCTESKVKSTATEYLKNNMKDPSSFKVEKVEVVYDSIPIFLNKELLSCANDLTKAIDEKNRYNDRDSYLWRKEIDRAKEKLSDAFISFGLKYQELKKKTRSVQYLVLVNCSGNNSYGSTISSKYIVVVDKDKTDKVLGEYRLDSDFAKEVVTAYMMSGNGELKQNEFGKIETEGMTVVEKFIFGDD